jgi:hypothetical protein
MTNQTLTIFDLNGIVIPDAISYRPETLFVRVLLVVIALGLIRIGWHGWKVWRQAAYRRAGLRLLEEIKADFSRTGDSAVFLAALSVLLKRVALAAFPRQQVAPLYGSEWLRFLDHTCPARTFDSERGSVLTGQVTGTTSASSLSKADEEYLVQWARTWIRRHRIPKPSGENQ